MWQQFVAEVHFIDDETLTSSGSETFTQPTELPRVF